MSLASTIRRIAGAATSNSTAGSAPAQPFVVTISHSLGRQEATRRIQDGLGEVTRVLAANKVVLADNRWSGDKGEFTVRALGQSVTALVEVMDDIVRIEARLPWMLAAFAERARGAIQSGGTRLLEKK